MICINPFNDLSKGYVESVEKVRRKEDGGAQTGQSRVVGLGAKVRRRGTARTWKCGRRCADAGRLMRGNASKGVQTGRGSCVGMRTKVRRRGAAGRSEYGRRYADGAKPDRGLGAKVRRRGTAGRSEYGRRCADGAKPDRGVGRKSVQAWRGMLIGIHRSLSEPIGIYRRGSALFGFVLIDSDKF